MTRSIVRWLTTRGKTRLPKRKMNKGIDPRRHSLIFP
jgi:hypothetical protein